MASRPPWPTYAVRALLLALLWALLTGGEAASWVVGLPVVVFGSLAALILPPFPSWRWRFGGAWRFLLYFVRQSLLSGLDVARRAFHPRCPVAPRLMTYSFSSLSGPARIFFANVVSLLPGTLSADLREQEVLIHALDHRQPIARDLARLEEKVAALFGLETGDAPGGRGEVK